MLPFSILTHFFWAALIFLAFYAVYRKYQENQIEMLKNFYMFFLVWSAGFFLPLAAMISAGYYLDSSMLMSLGYVLPHFFAFVSVGYLWKVQSSINFPKYSKLFWAFVAYGAVTVGYGLINMPEVAIVEGAINYGDSAFSTMIPLGMTVSALLIAGSSFYSAYLTEGETRKKLGLIGLGAVLALVVASILNNNGYEILGQFVNLSWILIFLSVAYWQKITDKMQSLRS